MARRTFGARRPMARRVSLKTWDPTNVGGVAQPFHASVGVSPDSTSTSVVLTFQQAGGQDTTILRTRGDLIISSSEMLADEIVTCVFGSGVAASQALSAPALERPIADAVWDGFYQYDVLQVTGDIADNQSSLVIDSKAMRKIPGGSGFYHSIQFFGTQIAAVRVLDFSYYGRTLLKTSV